MIRTKVLVVEDDESVQEFYQHFFTDAHKDEFEWRMVQTGEKALASLAQNPVDIVILDWNLPAMSGLTTLKHIRSNPATRHLLVFMATARTNRRDYVMAMESGADDYLAKPLYEDMLLATLHSLTRRRELMREEHHVYEADDLRLDTRASKLTIAGKGVHLEPKELDLLKVLLRRPNMIHSSRALWDLLWCYPSKRWNRTLILAISGFRKKLGTQWSKRLVTHYGKGYSFDVSLPVPSRQSPAVKT